MRLEIILSLYSFRINAVGAFHKHAHSTLNKPRASAVRPASRTAWTIVAITHPCPIATQDSSLLHIVLRAVQVRTDIIYYPCKSLCRGLFWPDIEENKWTLSVLDLGDLCRRATKTYQFQKGMAWNFLFLRWVSIAGMRVCLWHWTWRTRHISGFQKKSINEAASAYEEEWGKLPHAPPPVSLLPMYFKCQLMF